MQPTVPVPVPTTSSSCEFPVGSNGEPISTPVTPTITTKPLNNHQQPENYTKATAVTPNATRISYVDNVEVVNHNTGISSPSSFKQAPYQQNSPTLEIDWIVQTIPNDKPANSTSWRFDRNVQPSSNASDSWVPRKLCSHKPRAVRELEEHNPFTADQSVPAKRLRKTRDLLTYTTFVGLAEAEQLIEDFANIADKDPIQMNLIFKAAKGKNPDIITFDEAMSDPDPEVRKAWIKAMLQEIEQLEEKECWVECTKASATSKPVPSTWVLRIKRNPAGEAIKYKAQICLRGDLMQGTEEFYAPVVSWSSVRFFLVFAMIQNWETVSIDWGNAFVQAKLKEPMLMHTPRGFFNKFGQDGCLKLF